ncbi:hypothetical protein JS531_04975 [Bifidobacterium sp. CP2]|uniref:hypothetical protein n=1 Tax=Bifidobacterium sp. CP2 TaxID=2809025 RepID=UPI001BDD0756|nr:hypothetical protein [Bifidobacterium sp. CP2]MBT1181334.1 hypothetical protein [Bifidobacterium sp. CP2]
MFWRIITHVCGHQERISADGPYVVVEQRIRKAEQSMCDSCAGHVNRWDNELKGFCDLWGTQRDCDRAEPIRRRTLNQVDALARHARAGEHDAFAELRKQVLRRDDAAWWIEHKDDAIAMLAQNIEL